MRFAFQVIAFSIFFLMGAGYEAIALAQDPPGFHRRGAPIEIGQLPAGRLLKDLQSLSPEARSNALQRLKDFDFPLNDAVNSLRAAPDGMLFYEDPVYKPQGRFKNSTQGQIGLTAPVIGEAVVAVSTSSVFTLHNKPGSSRQVYLNFKGEVVSGTAWNSSSGISSNPMRAFSLDADYANLSQQEADIIAEIWKTVSEDYAPFDIDVTTERPSSFGPTVGHILISQRQDSNGKYIYNCNCGGVAYLNVWGYSNFYPTYQPALVFPESLGWDPKIIAEAVSHELGHNLSLAHDGRTSPSEGYYQGQGTGLVSWAPIMGVGYYKNVTQWSQGEYAYANNLQDDVAAIAARLTFRVDDHSNSTSGATLLVSSSGFISSTSVPADPSNAAKANKGIIETRSDIDYFYFDAAVSGSVNLFVYPDWIDSFTSNSLRASNLDVKITLIDSIGNVIVQSDVQGDTYAQINASIVAGRYYLAIEGVGAGNPSIDGYSDYGSLGRYFISGTIPNSSPTISIGAATYSVSEGAASITIPVTRSGTAGTASVYVTTANGTAIAGSDYNFSAKTLNFAAGVATQNIVISIINDKTSESSESFSLSLSSPIGVMLGSIASTNVTIADNDPTTVGFGSATYSVSEAGPNIIIPVIRLGTLAASTVSFSTANGIAVAGSDYTQSSGTLSFSSSVSKLDVTIPISNDTSVEGNETFTLRLSNPSRGSTLRTPSSTTVTIVDND